VLDGCRSPDHDEPVHEFPAGSPGADMSRQSRFLILSWDGGGNVPPALGLGARLAQRGHKVRVVGWPAMAQRVVAAGVEFSTYASFPPWPEGVSMDDAWADRMMPFFHGSGTRDDILAEIHAFSPDVLVVDCMMGAAFAAAGETGLPTAVLVHVLYRASSTNGATV
jgi:hypothetical protein